MRITTAHCNTTNSTVRQRGRGNTTGWVGTTATRSLRIIQELSSTTGHKLTHELSLLLLNWAFFIVSSNTYQQLKDDCNCPHHIICFTITTTNSQITSISM